MNRNLLIALVIGTLLVVAPMMIPQSSPTPIDPEPTPDQEEDITPSGPCIFCDGQGWVGDGRVGEDCSHCDRNGDGSKKDPLPDGIKPSPTSIDEDFHQIDEEDEPVAPSVPRQFWFDAKQEAFSIAERTGRNVILLLGPDRESCEFCRALADNLTDTDRVPESPTIGWVGWRLYKQESEEDLSDINSFPYVALFTPGDIDPITGLRTPKLLWEGVVEKDEINDLHKNLTLYAPVKWSLE